MDCGWGGDGSVGSDWNETSGNRVGRTAGKRGLVVSSSVADGWGLGVLVTGPRCRWDGVNASCVVRRRHACLVVSELAPRCSLGRACGPDQATASLQPGTEGSGDKRGRDPPNDSFAP